MIGTLTFIPGETTKTLIIEVKGDSQRETFYLDLFGARTIARKFFADVACSVGRALDAKADPPCDGPHEEKVRISPQLRTFWRVRGKTLRSRLSANYRRLGDVL